ncbi:hypothetical protein P154DRAFT_562225 [Amniculicola lignicola CBS 123094]|uniref:Uncharacterized protein n=1 Tax=Amniculicola lignicola CBS 123094 TaxID=1392246 RepID=A0A6A5WPK2_9PLEO|nr:hypothetical protein P154DRAFT_562225 [Amniculicola lignicola CBS 123094]
MSTPFGSGNGPSSGDANSDHPLEGSKRKVMKASEEPLQKREIEKPTVQGQEVAQRLKRQRLMHQHQPARALANAQGSTQSPQPTESPAPPQTSTEPPRPFWSWTDPTTSNPPMATSLETAGPNTQLRFHTIHEASKHLRQPIWKPKCGNEGVPRNDQEALPYVKQVFEALSNADSIRDMKSAPDYCKMFQSGNILADDMEATAHIVVCAAVTIYIRGCNVLLYRDVKNQPKNQDESLLFADRIKHFCTLVKAIMGRMHQEYLAMPVAYYAFFEKERQKAEAKGQSPTSKLLLPLALEQAQSSTGPKAQPQSESQAPGSPFLQALLPELTEWDRKYLGSNIDYGLAIHSYDNSLPPPHEMTQPLAHARDIQNSPTMSDVKGQLPTSSSPSQGVTNIGPSATQTDKKPVSKDKIVPSSSQEKAPYIARVAEALSDLTQVQNSVSNSDYSDKWMSGKWSKNAIDGPFGRAGPLDLQYQPQEANVPLHSNATEPDRASQALLTRSATYQDPDQPKVPYSASSAHPSVLFKTSARIFVRSADPRCSHLVGAQDVRFDNYRRRPDLQDARLTFENRLLHFRDLVQLLLQKRRL